MSKEERRNLPRIKSANLVSFKTFDEHHVLSNLGMGATQDLSMGGIKLYCAEGFPVPSTLVLDLALGEIIIKVKGRVVRAEELEAGEKYLIGIKFEDMREKEKKALAAFLDKKQ